MKEKKTRPSRERSIIRQGALTRLWNPYLVVSALVDEPAVARRTTFFHFFHSTTQVNQLDKRINKGQDYPTGPESRKCNLLFPKKKKKKRKVFFSLSEEKEG